MNKKKTALSALALVAVFIAGVIAGVQFAPQTITVTVEEAITILPEFVGAELFVGESGDVNFTITNAANVEIPLTVLAEVTAYPTNGNASDLMLIYPETMNATALDDTILTVGLELTTGAIAGNYTVTVTVTRI